jgi:CheY-like chemotaxis protein
MTDNPFSGRRILLVEDEALLAELLEDMLADLGCVVVGPAARVAQALALIASEAIDAALLDINLAGQMSYPVADALAARGLPFTFATGYRQDSLPSGYRIFPVLRKPFRLSELREALAELLRPKDNPPSKRTPLPSGERAG